MFLVFQSFLVVGVLDLNNDVLSTKVLNALVNSSLVIIVLVLSALVLTDQKLNVLVPCAPAPSPLVLSILKSKNLVVSAFAVFGEYFLLKKISKSVAFDITASASIPKVLRMCGQGFQI